MVLTPIRDWLRKTDLSKEELEKLYWNNDSLLWLYDWIEDLKEEGHQKSGEVICAVDSSTKKS